MVDDFAGPTDDGWCDECSVPAGLGDCGGCIALGSFLAECGDDPMEERCPRCGKPYEEFGDLGCEACDRRHPGYGSVD